MPERMTAFDHSEYGFLLASLNLILALQLVLLSLGQQQKRGLCDKTTYNLDFTNNRDALLTKEYYTRALFYYEEGPTYHQVS